MIRVTIYFATGRESCARDCDSIEQAFDMCTRYGMIAHAVNLRTDKLYIWRPEANNTMEAFAAKLADSDNDIARQHIAASVKETQLDALDKFTRAYIGAALWSSTDDNDTPLDANYSASDIAEETLTQMVADCSKFQKENAEHITEESYKCLRGQSVEAMAGHDFWLTRNGHGCGFWDGDWEEPHATAMDKTSKAFGEVNLYVGDDGRIYA